jgi:tetratricopeptide (TPR) repeat protein
LTARAGGVNIAGRPVPSTEEIGLRRQPYVVPPLLALVMLGAPGAGCGGGRRSPPPAPSAATLYSDGVSAYRAGDKERAVRLLTEAVRQNPNLAMAHSILGDIYKESGDYNNAATQYESLTKLDPYAADNHHRLAVSYHFLNRLRDAAASYLRAIKLDPRDWRSCMNLGLVYMSLGDNNAAVEYCQRAANLNPLAAVAHANLGVAFDARGNVAEAEAAYRKSLTIDPTQTGPAMNLARNLQYRGRTQEAVTVLENLTRAADSAAVRRRYGDALASAGREADALREYRQSLKLDPRHFPAMNAMASLLITQYRNGLFLDDRKRDEALAMWKQSLQINPDQPKVESQVKAWAPKQG